MSTSSPFVMSDGGECFWGIMDDTVLYGGEFRVVQAFNKFLGVEVSGETLLTRRSSGEPKRVLHGREEPSGAPRCAPAWPNGVASLASEGSDGV